MKKLLMLMLGLVVFASVADAQQISRFRVWPSALSSAPNQQTLAGNTAYQSAPVWCRGAKQVVFKFECRDSVAVRLTAGTIQVANDIRTLETYGDFTTSQSVPDTAGTFVTAAAGRGMQATGTVVAVTLVYGGASFGVVPTFDEAAADQITPAIQWDFTRASFQTGDADSTMAGLTVWAEVYR